MLRILMLTAVLLNASAQAAEPTGTLTLACQGTMTKSGSAVPQPFSVSIILHLDFTAGTVRSSGLGLFLRGGKITQVTDLTIHLEYSQIVGDTLDWTTGSLDRMTGIFEGFSANYQGNTPSPDSMLGAYEFSMKCTPTQRMF